MFSSVERASLLRKSLNYNQKSFIKLIIRQKKMSLVLVLGLVSRQPDSFKEEKRKKIILKRLDCTKVIIILFQSRHYTQHNNTEQSDTQHNVMFYSPGAGSCRRGTPGANPIKLFMVYFKSFRNELECLSLASLSSLV
jgi:hypothetical protein